MQPLTIIRSECVPLPVSDVDTDQIIPARFLTTTTREGMGEHLFHDWRYREDGSDDPSFVLNRPAFGGRTILVADRNFGCGSSREHAAWALSDYGFQAVISSEFADIFRSNSLKNGLLPVVVDPATLAWLLENPDTEVEIDVAASLVRLPDGREIGYPIDSFARYCLLEGIDQLGFLRQHQASIEQFERERPWTPE